MKITQEVREFAARQNQSADSFLAATPTIEADLSAEALAKAEEGMAEMSQKFREIGSELYIGADGRERD
jgi:phosphomethylpyrimidine synthase